MKLKSTCEKNPSTGETALACPLWRRLCAIFYDTILLVCVIFIAWQPVPLLPEDLNPVLGRGVRLGYLGAICYLFFAWFWCHGGQTLGMRAWKIKLVNDTAVPRSTQVQWKSAWIRFLMAIVSWLGLGAGFLFSLFHPEKLTWHDIVSKTRLVVVRSQ